MTDVYPENLNCDLHTRYCIAKADTGASNHYWMKKNGNVLKNVTLAPGPSVQLPNSELIHSTARGEIPLPKELSQDAKETMILPKLTSSNLISLGQLCDDDCEIILNKDIMKAIKNNKVMDWWAPQNTLVAPAARVRTAQRGPEKSTSPKKLVLMSFQ